MKFDWQTIFHYVFSTFLALASGALMFIPSAMVMKVRVFESAGMDAELAGFVLLCIVCAGPTVTVLNGLYRIFGSTDAAHAESFKYSFLAEGVAAVFEILAWACTKGSGFWSVLGQASFLSLSIGLLFYAIGNSVMSSSRYSGASPRPQMRQPVTNFASSVQRPPQKKSPPLSEED